jgi:hypothetical protein
MTSLNLRLDLKLGFVTLMLEKKVHRITVLIVASALWSSLERWTSEVVVVVGDVTIPAIHTEVDSGHSCDMQLKIYVELVIL